jgi:hypothetical protein
MLVVDTSPASVQRHRDYASFNFEEEEAIILGFEASIPSWMDDDQESREELKASIRAIRDEAQKMDYFLVVEKLETLREELSSAKRALANTSAESKELRELLRQNDSRVAMLQLERDLYKADAARFKNDLQIIFQKASLIRVSSLFQESQSNEDLSECQTFQSSCNRKPERTYAHVRLESKRESPVRGKYRMPTREWLLGYLTVPYKARYTPLKETESMPDKTASCTASIRRLVSLQQRVMIKAKPQEVEMTTSGVSIEARVQELHKRLRTSMDTARELRKRLAMCSRHNEALVGRLGNESDSTQAVQCEKEARNESAVHFLKTDDAKERRIAHSQVEYQGDRISAPERIQQIDHSTAHHSYPTFDEL